VRDRKVCPRVEQRPQQAIGDDLRIVEESRVSHHDAAPLHLLTTASLAWLQARLSGSQVDGRRFRSNILLEAASSEPTGYHSISGTLVPVMS
jgi:uncharacterized protein YcbX